MWTPRWGEAEASVSFLVMPERMGMRMGRERLLAVGWGQSPSGCTAATGATVLGVKGPADATAYAHTSVGSLRLQWRQVVQVDGARGAVSHQRHLL